jgi:cell division transport system permease protein
MTFLIARSRDRQDEADDTIVRARAPLVPTDTIASRALVTVISIMTFLAALTAGCAVLISDASRDWSDQVSREVTIQVRSSNPKVADGDAVKAADLAKATAGVAEVRAFSKAESEKLLEPWLGAGLDLSELAVPRLIVLKLDPGAKVDLAAFRKQLAQAVPNATLDDHRMWIDRLSAMAQTLVWIAIFVVALVFTAMALAVAFATRGAMAGSRHIVEVLHFVGAEDRFIAREFQRLFLRLGLKGGAIGGLCALGLFLASGLMANVWALSPGGDQIEALFGSFSLGPKGYALIGLIAFAIAILTGYMSRVVVFRHLGALE